MNIENNYTISLELLEDLAKTQDFVKELLCKHNIDKEICKTIHLVFDEICINVFTYNDFELIKLDIDIVINSNEIKLLFRDNGMPFNPVEYNSDEHSNLSIEERGIGKLGLVLVKHFADIMEYKYTNNKNNLIFTKYLSSSM
jgi:sigma-B regulation protein RsbU (phosphoserine phosphatase)